jgi:hypothetical protein
MPLDRRSTGGRVFTDGLQTHEYCIRIARSKMALAVIWISLVVGVVLGLWQRVASRTTGPIRTFAVVAAGLVVALSLLPHAIASEGLAGLAVALASVGLIPAMERLVRIPFRKVSAEGLRLELGYVGLLVHRFGDGVVMAVEGHGQELSWAVGAHEIPIVALVTLAYARKGLRQALVRAAVLGLSSSLGYWLVRSMPGTWHELHGWVDAIAAGILVHILAYEALPDRLETARDRAFDVLGAALGTLIVVLPSFQEEAHVPNVARTLLHGGLQAAPFLVLGLLGSAALLERQRRRTSLGGGLRLGLAFPWPSVEAFTLAAGCLGWRLGLGYLLAAAALAAPAAVILRRFAPLASAVAVHPVARGPLDSPPWASIESLVLRVVGWIAVGLLAASYIDSFLPGDHPLAALSALPRALFIIAIAVPASVCTAGAVPIAAALAAKGLSSVLLIAGLVLGPVLSHAFFTLTLAGVSRARAGLVLAPLGLGGLAVASGLDAAFGAATTLHEPVVPSGALEWIALACLAALVARSIWRVGIRGWLGTSLRALGPAAPRRHVHAH